MDSAKELQTVVSLCSGYGGLERGLELAGVSHRVLSYVEIEAFACANLVAKMEENQLDPSPVWTNVKTFPAHLFRDCIDVLLGGYPCQPFSYAGNQRGEDDPRHLWPYIRDIISVARPRVCFFENVDGHITKGLRDVLEDLEGLRYRATFGVFSAEECGAPHQRKRVFIMAHSNSSPSQGVCVSSGVHAQHPNPDSDGQLANTDCCGGREDKLPCQSRSGGPVQPSCDSRIPDAQQKGEVYRWPAYPFQEQGEHEKPRTIKPSLGGAADGSPNRLDELRLLGNGVVPQTAAKAWSVLNQRLSEGSNNG